MDGGVSRNDFLLQLVADLSGQKLIRGENQDTTALGTAFLIGLHTGIGFCTYGVRRSLCSGMVIHVVFM